jgi:hypothetical protein
MTSRCVLEWLAPTPAEWLARHGPYRHAPPPERRWQIAVSETAMAWHSGQNGTTDSFLSGPWFISQACDR